VVPVLAAPVTKPLAVVHAEGPDRKIEKDLLLDKGIDIDLVPLVILHVEVLPSELNLLSPGHCISRGQLNIESTLHLKREFVDTSRALETQGTSDRTVDADPVVKLLHLQIIFERGQHREAFIVGAREKRTLQSAGNFRHILDFRNLDDHGTPRSSLII
jgi:hypothetical protein